MSILIKDQKMPKEGCKDCPLVKRGLIFDVCPFLKREVDGNVERGGKPYDCPLVEVPEHGDLIDRDAMAKDLAYDVEMDERALDDTDIVGIEREKLQFDKDCKQNCMYYLTEREAVIPAERSENEEP